MKIFPRLISILLFISIVVIAYPNISNTINPEISLLNIRVSVGLLILFCSAISSLATMLFLGSSQEKNRSTTITQNTKLDLEIEMNKVKQLENKLKTLEELLKKVTQKR